MTLIREELTKTLNREEQLKTLNREEQRRWRDYSWNMEEITLEI